VEGEFDVFVVRNIIYIGASEPETEELRRIHPRFRKKDETVVGADVQFSYYDETTRD
jgi:hypothetical protein